MAQALSGVRVVEFGHFVQGPQCGQMLHDLGATVTKVETPGSGDYSRGMPLSAEDQRYPFLEANNRGKRSLAVDVGQEAGLAAVRTLIGESDVLIGTLRPGALEGLGLSYAACAAMNPRLIYASGSAFGPEGPYAAAPGVDLSAQAMGGLIAVTGSAEARTPAGAVVADSMAAQVMCSGILAALLVRERTGRGQRVETSLYGAQIWAQAAELTVQLIGDQVVGPYPGGHGFASPGRIYRVFETADGAMVVPGVETEAWPIFVKAIDRRELGEDPRFAESASRVQHMAALYAELEVVFRQRTTLAWGERLRAAGLRFAPVQNYAEVATDPQAAANGYVREATDEAGARRRVVGSPLRLSETPARVAARAPELGEQTEAVLLELGYDWERIAALRESGVI